MICITIAQESRRLALADMLNAAMLGADVIEVRLDRFEKDANLSELVAAKRKPVIFSCKRSDDGGQWTGTEEERLILLRSAVIAKADYVEIELDAAEQIRPFPGCQRVISYTNLHETPRDIADIYKEMLTKKPDVIKLTCKAATPEEAWPLVQLLAKPPVPTVVVGLGPLGLMLSLLGYKIGAPWTTAALEKGMEAYPGQPTINDLVDIYHYRDIGKKTRFLGVAGTDERAALAAELFNTAFAHAEQPHRVLPTPIGNLKLFKKIADAVRLQGVLLEEDFYEGLHVLATYDDSSKTPVLAGDFVFPTDEGWTATNTLGPTVANALTATLNGSGETPLKGRTVMLAGVGPLTRMVAVALRAQGAALIWASKNKEAAHTMSQTFGGRQLLWDAIYTTHHDILIVGRDGPQTPEDMLADDDALPLHPGYLKSSMTVVDLTSGIRPSKFLREANSRGATIITIGQLLVEQVRTCVQQIANIDIPRQVLLDKLQKRMAEAEM
jgi:3-dehydroquinate dehydratase/shikimate dehydrogenase